MTAPVPRSVDLHALPAMLTALRPPSILRHWPALAARADTEGWPASRFLAASAVIELADRDAHRIQRHLREYGLPQGKTRANFGFKAVAGVPSAHIEAHAAGNCVETGVNLIATGNSGDGRTHVLRAGGHALVEAGLRVLYTRTTNIVPRLQAAQRNLALEAEPAKEVNALHWGSNPCKYRITLEFRRKAIMGKRAW